MNRDFKKQFYDRISAVYDSLADEAEHLVIEKAIDRLNIDEDENVLEIGFGTGYGLMLLAKAVGEHGSVQGVDTSEKMVMLAEHRLENAKLFDQVTVQIGEVPPLSFDDNQFDAVFISFLFELMSTDDRLHLMKEIRRVLHDNGRLGLVYIAADGNDPFKKSSSELQSNFPHFSQVNSINPKAMLKQFGFQFDKIETVQISGVSVATIIAKCSGDSSSMSFHADPAVIESLVSNLGSREPLERMKARQELIDCGSAATSALCESLTSENSQVRWEAGKCLAAIADPDSAQALVQELYDRDSDAGWVASQALVRIGSASLEPLLTALTKAESRQSYNFYHAAQHVLRELSQTSYGGRLVALVDAFDDSEPQIRVPVEASKVLNELHRPKK